MHFSFPIRHVLALIVLVLLDDVYLKTLTCGLEFIKDVYQVKNNNRMTGPDYLSSMHSSIHLIIYNATLNYNPRHLDPFSKLLGEWDPLTFTESKLPYSQGARG